MRFSWFERAAYRNLVGSSVVNSAAALSTPPLRGREVAIGRNVDRDFSFCHLNRANILTEEAL
jgi:hypothetical protein